MAKKLFIGLFMAFVLREAVKRTAEQGVILFLIKCKLFASIYYRCGGW